MDRGMQGIYRRRMVQRCRAFASAGMDISATYSWRVDGREQPHPVTHRHDVFVLVYPRPHVVWTRLRLGHRLSRGARHRKADDNRSVSKYSHHQISSTIRLGPFGASLRADPPRAGSKVLSAVVARESKGSWHAVYYTALQCYTLPTMNITMRLLPLLLAAAMQQGPVEPGSPVCSTARISPAGRSAETRRPSRSRMARSSLTARPRTPSTMARSGSTASAISS